jgi:uncharacterized membrane protein YphA (DoxX/SURF4 family)
VDDPDGLRRLTPESVKQRVQERFDKLAGFYGLTEEQRKPITEMVKKFVEGKADQDPECVDAIFADRDFCNQLENYKEFLGKIAVQEKALFLYDRKAEPGNTPYNAERWVYDSGKKAAARQALLARAEGPIRAVEAAVLDARTVEQMAEGPPPHEKSQTAFSDWANMIGLTAVGVCLMLGLFTRLAALGGISLLCLYYFCMPPWPGLPEGPSEGHYLIVNKNMIEAIALAVIATSGVGRWAGLDAFTSAWRRASAVSEKVM